MILPPFEGRENQKPKLRKTLKLNSACQDLETVARNKFYEAFDLFDRFGYGGLRIGHGNFIRAILGRFPEADGSDAYDAFDFSCDVFQLIDRKVLVELGAEVWEYAHIIFPL
jgi:hypothetical protein